MQTKKKTNIAGLLLTLAVPGLCLFVLLPAMLSGNALATMNTIANLPDEVVVYYNGQSVSYTPQDEEYDLLVDAAYDVIVDETGIHEMGWADDRFNQARSEGIALEMFYSRPVKLPGNRVDIGDVYRLFIPLEVFGFNDAVVFRGGTDSYWGAPLRVENLDILREMVDSIIQTNVTVGS